MGENPASASPFGFRLRQDEEAGMGGVLSLLYQLFIQRVICEHVRRVFAEKHADQNVFFER